MCKKPRNASATSVGSSQYRLMAAASTATPFTNSNRATPRSACSRARCWALSGNILLLEFIQLARTLARSSETISCAARLASSCSLTLKEIAPTRACPPPPYLSQTLARFTTGGDVAHGFDPTDTLTRKLLLLKPTLYMDSGCK